MKALLVYTVLIVLFLPSKSVDAKNASHGVVDENVTVLHLLTLLPRGDAADTLLLAAEIAVEKINARDDLLPGYRLETITADTEICTETLITESYISFVKYVTDVTLNTVGVTGMTCASVIQAVSPLAGHPDFDLLQISAGAAPPTFTNVEAYPRLYRVISSSAVQNDALLALMEHSSGEESVSSVTPPSLITLEVLMTSLPKLTRIQILNSFPKRLQYPGQFFPHYPPQYQVQRKSSMLL